MTNETPDSRRAATDGGDLDHLDLTPLPGSDRAAAPDVQPAAAPAALDPDRPISITVILRRRAPVPDEALAAPMAREEFAERYGADPADVQRVTDTLTRLGATVTDADAGRRSLRVSGPTGVLARIFGADLSLSTSASPTGGRATHRHRTGGLSVPSELAGVIVAVLGLDDRPQSRGKFVYANPAAAETTYTPPQLGTVYEFPGGTDGSGQTVAIIELGGGFDQADLDAYFADIGVSSPTVTAVGVDGAENQPGQDPQGADGEVLLDIEVVGGLAPGADIVVYFAPNTDSGFVDAVSQAAHADPTPASMSISWGQSEDQWTKQARTAFDQALVDAVALGVTVTVASGDDGSSDRETDGGAHVDFPASSPHALACGGTTLKADAASGRVTSEVVWNNGAGHGATGGGVSTAFPLPTWQQNVGVPSGSSSGGRGVPDVAADADPQTGYRVRVDGSDTVIGGTSAVAPLWAALIARLAQATGKKFGLIQPVLYRGAASGQVPDGFRDVTEGSNGAFRAGPGWDACTGLGVPNGTQLLTALQTGSGN